jgi:hypothetical protein
MARRRPIPAEEVTPSILKFREKRKWQLTYRRYVVDKKLCPTYAPYFGLDIINLRQWFEYQFVNGETWENFGKTWQFDHIIPVVYFDFGNEEELKMCWNFTNIRVEHFQLNKNRGHRLDVLAAKNYFKQLFEKTLYPLCLDLIHKIDQLELSEFVSTEAQQSFIKSHWEYLEKIKDYSRFEFELLNMGKSIEEVNKENQFIRRLGQ